MVEKSVDEIVKKYKGADGYCLFTEHGLTKLIQTERQKREKAIEAEREKLLMSIARIPKMEFDMSDVIEALTQPNNPNK